MDPVAFAALAEPSRLKIVELLRETPCSVGTISGRLDLRQPQVSKHLKILSQAGWVAARKRTTVQIYELRPERFDDLAQWVEEFRALWEVNFRRLDDLLARTEEEKP